MVLPLSIELRAPPSQRSELPSGRGEFWRLALLGAAALWSAVTYGIYSANEAYATALYTQSNGDFTINAPPRTFGVTGKFTV